MQLKSNIMQELQTILALLIIFGSLFGSLYIFLSSRNKERMAMIESGVNPKDFIIQRKVSAYGILKWALLLAGVGLTKSIVEEREKSGSPDRPMMAYVSENKAPGDIYLIPLDMQDFRLETGAPAYVEFKSIPYKDVEVLEWFRRVSVAGNLYRAPRKRDGCAIASELYLEGVTHVGLADGHKIKNCLNFVLGYADLSYEVYTIVGK